MEKENIIKLFLVDDDALLLKSLEIQFKEKSNFDVKTFATGELCIDHLSEKPDFIILDYHLDGIDATAMDGIKTLDKIKSYNPHTPVIMLSSQDKIEVAINCMHHKASDYVIKSETSFVRLMKIIADIIEHQKIQKELSWYMDKM